MTKNITVSVNTGDEANNKIFEVVAGSGKKGHATHIKAIKGARYILEDPAAKKTGPKRIIIKRVGKSLHVMLEGSTEADLIIDDYYEEGMQTGKTSGLYGRTQDGILHEYITENSASSDTAINLADGGKPISQVLGEEEVSEGFKVADLGVSSLGWLGWVGAGAGVAGVAGGVAAATSGGGSKPTPVVTPIAKPSFKAIDDVGPNTGDITNGSVTDDTRPTFSGKTVPGATVVIKDGNTIIGEAIADANGNWSITPKNPLDNGKHTFTSTATSGAASSTSDPLSFTIEPTKQGTERTAVIIDPITGDNLLSSEEMAQATIDLTGKVTGVFTAGDTVTAYVNGKTYTTTIKADGSYLIKVPTSDIKADDDKTIEIGVVATDPVTGKTHATNNSQTYAIETPTGKGTALSINPVSDDNIISATESSSAEIAVTGKVTGEFKVGDKVTLTVNNKTFTGEVNDKGEYIIKVPTKDLILDSDTQIDAIVSATTSTGKVEFKAIQNYGVDLSPVPTNVTVILDPITGDNILSPAEMAQATIDLTGKVTGDFTPGDTVTAYVNGKAYEAIVDTNGRYTITVPTSDIKADHDKTIEISVAATDPVTHKITVTDNSQTYAIETPTGKGTALSINPVSDDNIISEAEFSSETIDVTGKVTGEFKVGDKVTLKVNNKTFTGEVNDKGEYIIKVPTKDLILDSDTQIDAIVSATTSTGKEEFKAIQNYGVDDAPAIVINSNATYTENQAAVVLLSSISIHDSDSQNLTKALLTITDKLSDGSDKLIFTDTATITGSFNDNTGVLTLTAVNGASKADFEAALKSVQYRSDSENPTQIFELGAVKDDTRTLSLTVSDDGGLRGVVQTSDPVNFNVKVIGVEDAPVITVTTPKTTIIGELTTQPGEIYEASKLNKVDVGITITDKDDVNFFGGCIRIANWNYKTDSFALDLQDANGHITPTLFDVRTATSLEAAIDKINELIAATTGQGYGLTHGGLLVNAETSYLAAGQTNFVGSLANDSALIDHTTNKVKTSFLQLIFGFGFTTGAAADANIDPFINSGNDYIALYENMRLASTDVGTFRPVEFSISDINKDQPILTKGHGYTTQQILDQYTHSSIATTREIAIDYSLNSLPTIMSDFTSFDFDWSSLDVNVDGISSITDIRDSSILNELDHLQRATITVSKALSTDAFDLTLQPNIKLASKTYDSATQTWTIVLEGVDSLQNYQKALESLVFSNKSDDPTLGGTLHSRQVNISVRDAADNGTGRSALDSEISSYNIELGSRNAGKATLAITGISDDRGVSQTDFITSDNTLIYSGTVSNFNVNAGDKVKVEIKNAGGTVVNTTYVTPVNNVWSTVVDSSRADGNYTVVATLVDTLLSRLNTATGGQATQVVTIDTMAPEVDPVNPLNPETGKASLMLDEVTADNIVNSTEGGQTIAVTGKARGDFTDGDKVTLTINNNSSYTGTVDANGVFSINVSGTDLFNDSDRNISAVLVAHDKAGNPGNIAATKSYSVDTNPVAYKTALSMNPVAGNNIIDTNEGATATSIITGKASGEFAIGDVVTVIVNGIEVVGSVLTAAGDYSITVNMSDLKADSDSKIEARIAATTPSGKVSATASQDYTVESGSTADKTTALSINTITADNIINAAENIGNIAVTGKVTGKFATGDVVTLVVNNKTVTGTVLSDGSFSIDIAASELVTDTDTQIDGSVTGTGGTFATAMQNYAVDLVGPTPGPSPTGTTELRIDAITGDDVINATEAAVATTIISGKATGEFKAGDVVTLKIGSTEIGTGNLDAGGNYFISVSTSALTGATTKTVTASLVAHDAPDNSGIITATHSYSVDSNPVANKTALSMNPVAGNNIIDTNEGATPTSTISGTATGEFAIGDVVTVVVNNKELTTAVSADGSYSITVNMSDLKADSDSKIEARIAATTPSGKVSATASQDYTVESDSTADKTTALSIDTITADNIIDATENTGNIAVTGKVTGKFATGDVVTLVVNNKTVIGTVHSDGSFSISVAATDLVADTDTQIDGSVTGTGGTFATAMQNYAVDLVGPTPGPRPAGTTELRIDAITGDDVINATEAAVATTIISGKATGEFKAGDVVTLKIGSTENGTGNLDAGGNYFISVSTSALTGATTKTVTASLVAHDAPDNSGIITATHSYSVDSNPVANKTALSMNPVAGNNIIDTNEGATATSIITGKASGEFAIGDVVTVIVNGIEVVGSVLTAAGDYSITVNMADLKADSDSKIEARIAATTPSGKVSATASQDYTVESGSTADKTTALSIDTITTDNIINAAENTGNIAVTGKVTGKFATGDVVTLVVNNKTVTGTLLSDGSFSIDIAASELVTDTDTQIDGSVTGTGGTFATAMQNYAVDLVGPTPGPSPAGTTELRIDAITGDDVINATEAAVETTTISGKATGEFKAGDVVTLSVGNTSIGAGNLDAGGNYFISVLTSALTGATTKTVTASLVAHDASNNSGTIIATHSYSLDTNPVAYKTALSMNPVAVDNIISTGEQSATSINITGKASGEFAIGDVVTVIVNGIEVVGSVLNVAGDYSITVNMSDLKADSDSKIEARIAATTTLGKVSATASQDYTVESDSTADKTTALSIDTITADNIIDATENPGTIAVTGKVTGKYLVGDEVTLLLNDKEVKTNVLLGGLFTVNIAVDQLLADTDTQIEASVTGTGGTFATAMQNYAVNLNLAPFNTVPGAQTVAEDTLLAITGLNVMDVDGNFANTQLSVVHGKLTVTLSGLATISAGGNGSGSLTLSGSETDINATLASLKYLGASNYNGPDTLSIVSKDNLNATSATNTVAINVTSVNDAPTAANKTITLLEDSQLFFGASDFGFADASDSPANALSAVIITTLPTAGTLKLNGTIVFLNQSIAVLDLNNLVFEPALNGNGTGYATFGFKVQDNGGLANGGVDTSTTANTITFNVTAVNDAPTAANKTVTIVEDGSRTLTAADFGFADASDSPANILQAVIITTLPTAGTLKLNGTTVGLNESIAVADLVNLVFTPTANANGTGYASIGFKVQDTGGIVNGGVDTSTINTLTIDVTAVNDAAIISGIKAGAVVEAGGVNNQTPGIATASGTLTSIDVDGIDNAFTAVTTSTISTGGYGHFVMTNAGVWTYTVDDNNAAVQALATVAATLNDTFTVTAADGTTQVISVTITGKNDAAVISGSIAGTVVEAGGVINGTPGTPTATGTLMSTDVDGIPNSFTVKADILSTGGYGKFAMTADGMWTYTLNNINPTVEALAAATTLSDTFTVTAVDGTAQLVTVTITGSNDTAIIIGTRLGAITEDAVLNTASGTFTVTDVDTNQAIFQTPTSASLVGTYGTFTFNTSTGVWGYTMDNTKASVQALSNGASDQDTLEIKSMDGSATRTVFIEITGVNDQPTYTHANIALSGVEDTVKIFTISDALEDQVSDVDSDGAVRGIAISVNTATAAQGVWEWSHDGLAWQALPSDLASTNALYLKADELLRFTPTANYNGPVSPLEFQVADNTFPASTVSGSRVNVNLYNSATGAMSAAPTSFNLTLASVNDAPTGSDNTITLLEDGSRILTAADFGFADVIDDNTLQAVIITTLPTAGTLKLNSVDVSLGQSIAVADLVNLVFTPAANANGTGYASIGFKVQDTGGTANFGVDTSTAKTLTFNVTAVNDAAVISGDKVGAVIEAGGVNNQTLGTATASGTLTSIDVDGIDNAFTAVTTSTGVYGSFEMTNAGKWTYTLDNDKVSVQALVASDAKKDTFTVTTADGTEQVITVNITGSNDAAVIDGVVVGSVTASADVSAEIKESNTLTVTDVDKDEAVFQELSLSQQTGTYGYFSFDTSTNVWEYTLDTFNSDSDVQKLAAGESATDTLVVKSLDGTSQNVVVTINGVNNLPTFVNNPQNDDIAVPFNTSTSFTVSSRLDGIVSDIDFGSSVKGIAITSNAVDIDKGVWSWSEDDGLTWNEISFSVPTPIAALYLNLTDLLRFSPAKGTTGGAAALEFLVADDTLPDNTFSGTILDVTSDPATGPFSVHTASLLAVVAANQAPTITGDITTVSKVDLGAPLDATFGQTIASMIGISDKNLDHEGVPVGLAFVAPIDATLGTAWYSIDEGANWSNLTDMLNSGTVASDTHAFVLDSTALVYFENANSAGIGKLASVEVRTWDGTDDNTSGEFKNINSLKGGTGAYSADSATLKFEVIPPVVLDMNRDGLISYSQVQMDVNGDGHLDQTAWVAAQDGVLVWDKYADGKVHDNSQYAFSQYGAAGSTDLQGLAAGFDSNQDGLLNATDAKFGEFKVWQDANQNGVTDAGEMLSLEAAGITSIELVSDGVVRHPAVGVIEAGHSSAIAADGSSVLVADAAFNYSSLAYLMQGNSLNVSGAAINLDLSSVLAVHSKVTAVDLTGLGANTLALTLNDVLNTTATNGLHQLMLTGDANDSVQLNAHEWTNTGTTVTEGDHSYAVYNATTSNEAQLLIDQAMVNAGHVM